MNPSSTGWIQKFINDFGPAVLQSYKADLSSRYQDLRRTGFIYGVSVESFLAEPVSHLKLSLEELTKINLLHALLLEYHGVHPKSPLAEAVPSIIQFYKSIERGKQSFFHRLSLTNKPSAILERILSARINESNSFLKRDVTSLLTYALLYVDVLGYVHYLKKEALTRDYLDRLEHSLIHYSLQALLAKQKKNKYDLMVVEMVKDSDTYVETDQLLLDLTNPNTAIEDSPAKRFVLDLSCLAVWDDRKLDSFEAIYLNQLTVSMGGGVADFDHAWEGLMHFSKTHEAKIQLFDYNHPVRQFYEQATDTVGRLILRNRDRLLTELNESGELLQLLAQSAQRELTPKEKRKIRSQLVDIFKTVPSLTIFMLPGGTLLLPVFIKLIPKLLPSAFDDNRLEKPS